MGLLRDERESEGGLGEDEDVEEREWGGKVMVVLRMALASIFCVG